MTTATTDTVSATMVGMGHIALCKHPEHFKSILGSCIGLVIYHPRLKVGAMAHIVMPDAAGRSGPPGKFADTAIPHMLHLLRDSGAPMRGLVAKFAGGSNMFGTGGPMQIGEKNAQAVARGLQVAGIEVYGQDTGGKKGRRITFCCDTGIMALNCAGETERTL